MPVGVGPVIAAHGLNKLTTDEVLALDLPHMSDMLFIT